MRGKKTETTDQYDEESESMDQEVETEEEEKAEEERRVARGYDHTETCFAQPSSGER